MLITKITPKTVTIKCEPGDRIMLDSDGFCANVVVLRWNGNNSLMDTAKKLIKKIKTLKSDDSEYGFMVYQKAKEELDYIKNEIISTLPKHRVSWVWVGHSF